MPFIIGGIIGLIKYSLIKYIIIFNIFRNFIMANIFSEVPNFNLSDSVMSIADQVNQLHEIAKTTDPDQSIVDQLQDMINVLRAEMDQRIEQFAV